MTDHKHTKKHEHCDHCLHACEPCDEAYCCKCVKQWQAECHQPHYYYPYTWTYTQPTYPTWTTSGYSQVVDTTAHAHEHAA